MANWRLLVFGATGAIGSAVVAQALERGWEVVGVSRGAPKPPHQERLSWRQYDALAGGPATAFADEMPFDGICWAHGANLTDSVATFDAESHLELYRANCLSVMLAMTQLRALGLFQPRGARMVVVSSIWQERARCNKLSYSVTKAAVGGLVRSASVDLGQDGHLINAVLPGVLDTPMSRANLTDAQIAAVTARTTLNRLPDLTTVAETICFLCSSHNRSVSGQSIVVDLGMSNAHLV